MEPTLVVLVAVAVWALIGGLPAAWIAGERGRSATNGFLAGVFFGPIAVVTTGVYMECPECREGIRAEATCCPHCRADIPNEVEEPQRRKA